MQTILKSNYKCVLAITGGGTSAIGDLLKYGGGSNFLVESRVVYSKESFDDFIGSSFEDKYCSDKAARILATKSFILCNKLTPSTDKNNIGVGVTCSLATTNQRENRENKFFVAIQSKDILVSFEVNLNTNKSRLEQEEFVSKEILKLINGFVTNCSYAYLNTYFDVDSEYIINTKVKCSNNFIDRVKFSIINDSCKIVFKNDDFTNIIFPGSFNPMHSSHLQMAEYVSKITGKSINLEISINNIDKNFVDSIDITNRVAQIASLNSDFLNSIYINNLPLFKWKASFYKNSKFIIGWDTLLRINDKKYYKDLNDFNNSINEIINNGCSFIVFPRMLNGQVDMSQLEMIDKKLLSICEILTVVPKEMSSTEVRKKKYLEDVCISFFGGVDAWSPVIYKEKLAKIAEITNRNFDDQFVDDVNNILKNFGCSLN